MHGVTGRALFIDVGERRWETRDLDPAFCRRWYGGNGTAAALLYEMTEPGGDPLAPQAPFIMASGPLNGSPIPWTAKWCAAARSPLSGTHMDSLSSCGLGVELKFAGYDVTVLRGRSAQPVIVFIDDGNVRFLDATTLWGRDALETQALVTETLGDPTVPVMAIGPAGERLVRYAAVISGRRALGTGGMGAVLGSKNVKAIAARGTGTVRLADPEGAIAEMQALRASLAERPASRVLSTYGTAVHTLILQSLGGATARNFQYGTLPDAEALSGERLYESHVVRNLACSPCLTPCGHVSVVKSGPHAGASTIGPEYQGLGCLGMLAGIDDIRAVIASDELTDRLGVGQISVGNCIAFAMECFERGLVTEADTDGLALRFGDAAAAHELMRRIAYREGDFARLLGEGVKRAAAAIGKGAEDFAMHVKGLEMGSFDPRQLRSQAVGYAVSNRGPIHCEVRPLSEFFGLDDWRDARGAGRLAKTLSDWSAVANSLVWCLSAERMVSHRITDRVAQWVNITTGWDATLDELEALGERIQSIERAFNVREGFRRADDRLPKRAFDEVLRGSPGTTGPEHRLTREDHDLMLDAYYDARGWDRNGVPTEAHLRARDLGDVADDLRARGLLEAAREP